MSKNIKKLATEVQLSILNFSFFFLFQGALDLKNKVAKDALIPLDSVVSLDINSQLDEATMDFVI